MHAVVRNSTNAIVREIRRPPPPGVEVRSSVRIVPIEYEYPDASSPGAEHTTVDPVVETVEPHRVVRSRLKRDMTPAEIDEVRDAEVSALAERVLRRYLLATENRLRAVEQTAGTLQGPASLNMPQLGIYIRSLQP